MPDWIVPVLRLVSTTHVEPTTGVVLSQDGLVLVPADFAAPGDEIIVLDGGTDIIRNGRPARLEQAFPELGLEVLRAEGLRRAGAPLATEAGEDGASLALRAFPPAEQIAEGAPPVRATATIRLAPASEQPALASEEPLPNVTGVLLDACGNLAGISMADGVQTLAASTGTQYRWQPALQSLLSDLGLPITGEPCSAAGAKSPPASEAEPDVGQDGSMSDIETPPPVPDEPPAGDQESEPGEVSEDAEPTVEELPPFEDGFAEEGADTTGQAVNSPPASWPWLFAAMLLLAAGVWLRRRRRDTTAPLPPDHVSESGGGAKLADEEAAPTGDGPAPISDSRLVLRGMLADGRSFEVATAVSEQAINVEIGRGAVDVVIDSASVSRRHARLNGTREALTLTDLGSSNGTTINGVPCLEGEIMYLVPGDIVILGDARFTISIEAAPTAGGEK
jgi:MYXO-CTERM domain-containing protein